MKVCYVITKGQWGGAQRYVYDLAVANQAAGDETIVVCGPGPHQTNELRDRLAAAEIRTIVLPSLGRDVNPLADWRSYRALAQLLRREQPDILHLNSSKIGGLGALAGRVYNFFHPEKLKIIYTAHGWAFNEPRPWFSRLVIRLLSWLTIQLCHQVIVVAGREERQALLMPLVSARKIHLIYNGIAPIKFLDHDAARAALILREARLAETTPALWLGTIAELHPNKGLDDVLTAAVKLRNQPLDFVWVLIGAGEDEAKLKQAIIEQGLNKQVFLLGALPVAAQYLKAFDLFVLPSVKEGLPYVLLEAGQAALPVISTGVGGIPEIIHDGKTGRLIPPHDPGALAAAVNDLNNQPSQRQTYGQALARRVELDFTVDKLVAQTRQIYNKE